MLGSRMLLLVFLSFFLTGVCQSQTLEEAIEVFNKGATLANQDDYQGAIEALEKCVDMCNAIGAEADATRMNAEGFIPNLYYKQAAQYLQNKEYEEGAEALKETVKVAKKYNDFTTKNKAEGKLPAVYYTLGNAHARAGEYEKAEGAYSKALEFDPEYSKVYLAKALNYRKQDQPEMVKQSLDKGLELSQKTNDNRTEKNITKVGKDYFLKLGNDAVKTENYDDAVKYINYSFDFEKDQPQAYYLLASVYNKISKWDKTIETVNEALKYEDGSDEKKARLYFEMAKAYQGKGDTENACQAYKNAAFGAYVEHANYQMKHVLKCE